MTTLFLALTVSFLSYLIFDLVDGAIKLWNQCAPITSVVTSLAPVTPIVKPDYIVTKFNAWENETGTWVNEFEGWSNEFDAWDNIFDTWVSSLEIEFALEVAKRNSKPCLALPSQLLLAPAVDAKPAKSKRAPRKAKTEQVVNPGFTELCDFFNSATTVEPTLPTIEPTTPASPMYHKSLTSLYDKFVRKSNGDNSVLNDVETLLTEFKRLATHQGYDWKEVMSDLAASSTVEPTLPTVEPLKAKRGRPCKAKVEPSSTTEPTKAKRGRPRKSKTA